MQGCKWLIKCDLDHLGFSTRKRALIQTLMSQSKIYSEIVNLSVFLFFIDSALQDAIDISDDEQSQEMLSTENVVRTSIRELRRAGLKID